MFRPELVLGTQLILGCLTPSAPCHELVVKRCGKTIFNTRIAALTNGKHFEKILIVVLLANGPSIQCHATHDYCSREVFPRSCRQCMKVSASTTCTNSKPINNFQLISICNRTCAMSRHCDSLIIATEVMDILVDPFECQLLIFHPHIARIFRQSQREETKDAQPKIYCDLSFKMIALSVRLQATIVKFSA